MKYFTLIFISFLFVCSIGAQSQVSEKSKQDIKIPKVEYRGGIYYMELDGKTPYERGYQHGKALDFVINKALRNFNEWLRDNAGIKEPDKMIQEFAKNTGHINTVKELLPELYQEMKGIADGANVDFNELFLYQSFDELFLFLMKSGALKEGDGHCTTIGVYGRKDLPNYVTHNNDIPTYHEGAVTVLKIKYPNSDLVILQQTFAGQIGQNGVNNYGVGVGMNTIADLPTSDQGIPVSFNVRKILESKNRTEAVAYLKSVHFGTSFWQVVVRVGTEVTQTNERFRTRVFNLDAAGRGNMRNENLVGRVLAESNHRRRLQIKAADPSATLHCDPTARTGIF